MKILTRTQFGNPILRVKAKKVSTAFLKTTAFRKLVAQMFYTMKRAYGVGLAAPQIGKSLQVAVIQVSPTKFRPNILSLPKTVIINPRILKYSKAMEDDWEGCLSCMGIRGRVPRSMRIRVQYMDENAKILTKEFTGFLARVFQHEIDHLNGFVYVDRMRDMKTLITLTEFNGRVLKKK